MLSRNLEKTLRRALALANARQHEYATLEHLLMARTDDEDATAVLKAGAFTFNADGTWSYSFGGGRWVQVDSTVFWNFSNAAGLVYTATVHADAMSGIMGYASAPPNPGSGCFYALRAPSPAPAATEPAVAPEAVEDPAVGP